ncbi:GDSL-type esterase/lipase family protein [Massilia sp. TSP1-1-2]|uniref:GDSL-type esterase/lipase family protein n=1 Tax=Massilia sp. TSP1-1-2 TaxID=2804649 RepID=UPI003CFAAC61
MKLPKLLPLALLLASAAAHAGDAYLFTYFTNNGEDGLHLAASSDGYRWDKLNGGKSYLQPKVGKSRLMRDPCIVRGPDGTYHMVWTSGWNENNIGYASSTDLVNWSEQKELPVMAHEPTVLNAWAPEITYDDKRGEFLIFWASTIPGKFPLTEGSSEEKYNHRMYATTTRDFKSFTPTKLFYDPGFSVIDATFVRALGKSWLMVKDETRHPPRKYLQLAAAPDVRGPFGQLGAPITKSGLWVEGPTALQVGQDVIVYYDAYTSKHYGALRSPDMVNWEDVTAKMQFPDDGTALRMRHGTAIAVPAALVDTLRSAGAPATTIADDDNYRPRLNYQTYFNDYVASRRGQPAQIVFVGDSITEQWRWGAGWPVWKRHFEERGFDFGLGADKTQHTLWRLENIALPNLAPKLAVVMIGTNNVQNTPDEIAAGVKAVLAATQRKFPAARIALMSILPNARATGKMAQANLQLAKLADDKRVFYIDLAARFTPEGDNWKGLSRDKLHLSAEGYEMWASALEPLLKP